MKMNLSKIYWPADAKLYAAMKRLNKEAISKFTNHPYAVKKELNDKIQDQTKAEAGTGQAYTRSIL